MAGMSDLQHERGLRFSEVVPFDLIAVFAFVVLADAALVSSPVRGSPLATLLGLVLLMFAPGYVFVAFLFPGTRVAGVARFDSLTDLGRPLRDRGLDGVERVALAFGLSLALLPLLGLAVSLAVGGFTEETVLTAVTGFVFVGAVAATARRYQVPPESRFVLPVERSFDWVRHGVTEPSTPTAVVNVVLAISVVVAVVALGSALLVPKSAETYSDFYLLARNDAGDLVTSGFPTTMVSGEPQPLVMAVANHEGAATTYTVVVELQQVSANDQVTRRTELARATRTVAPGQTWTLRRSVVPTMVGDNLRLQYYLYKGPAPGNPDVASAYRHLHLWVTVTAPAAATS